MGDVIDFPDKEPPASALEAYVKGLEKGAEMVLLLEKTEGNFGALLAGATFSIVSVIYESSESPEMARTLIKQTMERVEMGYGPE
jgi:hypothetical protein